MGKNVFFPRFYQLCRENGTTPNAMREAIGASSGSITAWKRGVTPRAGMVMRIAEYFGVPVSYLMGTDEPATVNSISNEELKFALFGGDREISDEMLDEVRQFAQFLKSRK